MTDDILALLTSLGIPFVQYDHPAVYSCEEATLLCPAMPGAMTKQLLMTDKKRTKVLLAIVMHDKRVDMKQMAREHGLANLSFASHDMLADLLHVTPGSVTPLGLIFDTSHRISVVIDEDAWATRQFLFHPLVNTITLTMDCDGLQRFLAHTGHTFSVQRIPQKIHGTIPGAVD